MSQQIGGYPPATTAGSPAGQPTTQVARDEATEVGVIHMLGHRSAAVSQRDCHASSMPNSIRAQHCDLRERPHMPRSDSPDMPMRGRQLLTAEGHRAAAAEP